LLTKAESLLRYQNPAMTVEQLAAALNMTTRTLNRKMKLLVQESPKDFITRVRIETASVLLESPEKLFLRSQVHADTAMKQRSGVPLAP
jgi:transcriptional regulator GlxA family with amidase domain